MSGFGGFGSFGQNNNNNQQGSGFGSGFGQGSNTTSGKSRFLSHPADRGSGEYKDGNDGNLHELLAHTTVSASHRLWIYHKQYRLWEHHEYWWKSLRRNQWWLW